MVALAMKIEVKNPEDYTEFDNMNPGNSAPGVVWLASDESLHVTGQVLRLVGNNLASTGRGRWASSSSRPTRTARRSSGTRSTSAASSTATPSAAKPRVSTPSVAPDL